MITIQIVVNGVGKFCFVQVGSAAGAVIQSYPPNGGYPGNELSVKIARRVFVYAASPVTEST